MSQPVDDLPVFVLLFVLEEVPAGVLAARDEGANSVFVLDPAAMQRGVIDAAVRIVAGEEARGEVRTRIQIVMEQGRILPEIDLIARLHHLLYGRLGT